MDYKLKDLELELSNLANPKKAESSSWFFKTGPGQYAEGDKFLGISVPVQRLLVKKYANLDIKDVDKLLHSQWHEKRLIALLMLVSRFKKAQNIATKTEIYNLYMTHLGQINNWDLVDSSARDIIGAYLFEHQNQLSILTLLASDKSIWKRRIAVIASFYFLNKGDPSLSIKLAEVLLHDEHDLAQKAVGWMLREMGKRVDNKLLIDFLDQNSERMPRTMLRYSIEHLTQTQRRQYMSRKTTDGGNLIRS